jgi:hypothetical protein
MCQVSTDKGQLGHLRTSLLQTTPISRIFLPAANFDAKSRSLGAMEDFAAVANADKCDNGGEDRIDIDGPYATSNSSITRKRR